MQNLDELFENLNEFVKNFEILIQKNVFNNIMTIFVILEMILFRYANQNDSISHQMIYYH